MFLYVLLVEIVFIYICKDIFKVCFIVGGKLNFNDVCLVFCYCRILFFFLMVLIVIL